MYQICERRGGRFRFRHRAPRFELEEDEVKVRRGFGRWLRSEGRRKASSSLSSSAEESERAKASGLEGVRGVSSMSSGIVVMCVIGVIDAAMGCM